MVVRTFLLLIKAVFILCHIIYKRLFQQERAFGELEKNSDKHLSSETHGQTDPPSHFHQLLTGLHKHLLAHCYIHCSPEVYCSISCAPFLHRALRSCSRILCSHGFLMFLLGWRQCIAAAGASLPAASLCCWDPQEIDQTAEGEFIG